MFLLTSRAFDWKPFLYGGKEREKERVTGVRRSHESTLGITVEVSATQVRQTSISRMQVYHVGREEVSIINGDHTDKSPH